MNIVKYVLIITLSLYTFLGYAQKEIPVSHPYSKEYVDKCTKKMLESGTPYYYEIYLMHSNERNLLYDMLMADKYNNSLACSVVYHSIVHMGETYKYTIDKELWNVAFYYLQKGADNNESNCIWEMIRLYEKGNTFITADTLKAEYYREKAKQLKE